MSGKLSLQEVEDAVEQLDQKEQQHVLSKLLSILNISKEDLALLKVAEPSFDFWNNPEDAVYDNP
jgi:hypothetical protein